MGLVTILPLGCEAVERGALSVVGIQETSARVTDEASEAPVEKRHPT